MRLAFALLIFVGCTLHPSPPPTALDGGTTGDTPCATYCQLADTKLHCTFAAPTAAGASCIEVCRGANDPIGPLVWDFNCRLSKTSCADIAKCQ